MKLIIKTELKTIEIDDVQIGSNPQTGSGVFYPSKKSKCLAPIDEELLKSVKEFANNFVTESRLKQGVEFLKTELLLEPIPENTGAFIKWIVTDIFKEENENILANDLNPKKVAQEIGTLARKWYFNYIEEV